MTITIGAMKQLSDQPGTVKAAVLMNSDKVIPNPLTEVATPQVVGKIYEILGLTKDYFVADVLLIRITSGAGNYSYNFSMKFAKAGTKLDTSIGPQGEKGDQGNPGPKGDKGDKGDPGSSGGDAGGDLFGTYPNPTVVGIQGLAVSSTTPTNGQALVWNTAADQWEPGAGGGGGTLAGDVVGPSGSNVLEAIQGLSTRPSSEAFEGLFARVTNNNPFVSPRASVMDGDAMWVAENDRAQSNLPVVRKMRVPAGTILASVSLSPYSTTGVRDLAQDSQYIYCACWQNGHVAIISKATNAVVGWGSLPDFEAVGRQVTSVCADDAGHFFVIGFGRSGQTISRGVFRFTTASCIGSDPDTVGPDLSSISASYSSVRKIRYAYGNLWIASGTSGLSLLLKLDPTDLSQVDSSEEMGQGMNVLAYGGNLYVADATTNTVKEYGTSCNLTNEWSFGEGGLVDTPDGMAASSENPYIFVTDANSSTAAVIDVTQVSPLMQSMLHAGFGEVSYFSGFWYACGFNVEVGGGVFTFSEETFTGGPSIGGGLSLSYRNVDQLQGRLVSNSIPSNGNVLTWNGCTSQWEPVAPAMLAGYTDTANTALGVSAFQFGGAATNIGYSAGSNNYGANSVAVGAYALSGNSSFFYKDATTAVGAYAGQYMGGTANTVVGYSAAIGSPSYSWTGSSNVYVGDWCAAGIYGHSASGNTFVGSGSAGGSAAALSGNYNSFVGYFSGRNLTSGVGNVAVGYQAGDTITTGTTNICVGNNSDVGAGTTSCIAIGTTAVANTTNGNIQLGTGTNSRVPGATTATLQVGVGAVTYECFAQAWTNISDERLKENIVALPSGLDFVGSLRPVQFNWKSDEAKTPSFGFIAQEVKEAFDGKPHAAYREDDANGWAVNYDQMIAPLVKAVQELSAQVANLQLEVAVLKSKR